MSTGRLIGIVIFAVGVVLLYFAYQSSNAPLDEISNELTGRYSSETMWYLGAGIVAAVGGGLLAVFGARR